MGIQVVRFEHQSERLHGYGEEGPDEIRTLLFDPRLERGTQKIGDRYRNLEAGARSAELLIVRGSDPDIVRLVEEDPILRTQRKGGLVSVLAPPQGHTRPTLQPISWAIQPENSPSVNDLREAEILCGLRAEQAIFRHDGCHYLLPSASYHADAFVRLADSLQDHVDLVRLSDWLIEMVDERTALAADNGSLLGLLATLALRVHEAKGSAPPIATLNEYPISPTAIAETVNRFRARGDHRILFCVSVNSSGRIAREVAALDGVDTQVVAICETRREEEERDEGATGDGIERFARHEVERWKIEPDGRCEKCPEWHLLSVDPHSYEVRTNVRLKPEGLDLNYVAANRELWEAANKADAVRLHVEARLAPGSPAETRHLAVQLDVKTMLEQVPAFRTRCLEKLREIKKPDLVLIPEHDCSAALKALVLEAFDGLTESQIHLCRFGSEAPDFASLLEGVNHVLVIDDTLVSGGTLTTLRRMIHKGAREHGGATVSIFVPLSKPSHPSDEKAVRRCAEPTEKPRKTPFLGGLHCAYRMLLPDKCPWCAERDMLTARLGDLEGDSRTQATERRAYMNQLREPLLPRGGDDEGTIVGSFFGDLDSIPAFAAVSALAQHMLVEMEEKREVETFKIIDVPLILQAFFDPIIVAAMLRTTPRRQLRDPWREPVVSRTIKENAKDYPDSTIAELGLAAIDGKLPAGPVRELLEARGGWAQMYVDLLEGY